eukprot:1187217-Pleurochrysis_carterae.AAC.1
MHSFPFSTRGACVLTSAPRSAPQVLDLVRAYGRHCLTRSRPGAIHVGEPSPLARASSLTVTKGNSYRIVIFRPLLDGHSSKVRKDSV